MYELLIFCLLMAGVSLYFVPSKTKISKSPMIVVQDSQTIPTVEEPKPGCSSCGMNKRTESKYKLSSMSIPKDARLPRVANRVENIPATNYSYDSEPVTAQVFKMAPMGDELDPSSRITPKIEGPDGQISTVLTNRPDITNLKGLPWEDFYPNAGKGVKTPGVQPVFGLQNAWTDAPVRACGRTTVPFHTYCQYDSRLRELAKLYYH